MNASVGNDFSRECLDTAPVTDLETYTLPTPTNLHSQLEKWLTPYKNSGITLAPLPNKKNKTAKKRKTTKPDPLASQHIKLNFGLRLFFGSKSRVDIRIKKNTYSLFLSTTDTPAIWQLLSKFPKRDETPEFKEFNEKTFSDLIKLNFE